MNSAICHFTLDYFIICLVYTSNPPLAFKCKINAFFSGGIDSDEQAVQLEGLDSLTIE